MNSDLKAIVIFYNGPQPDQIDLDMLLKILGDRLNLPNQQPTVLVYNSDEIARGMVHIDNTPITVNIETTTPEERAIMYIGDHFNASLAAGPISFLTEFSCYMTSLKFTNADPEMTNAVKVIVQAPNPRIRSDIRSKYHINKKVLEMIVNIGKNWMYE